MSFTSVVLFALMLGLGALYIYVEFLRGRLDRQTELIAVLSQAIQRLENEIHGRSH